MDKNTKIITLAVVGLIVVVALYVLSLVLPVKQLEKETFDSMQCWRCEELLKIDAVNLEEAINSVSKGDIGSKKTITLDMGGDCATGIYLAKRECWKIEVASTCSDELIYDECMDVSSNIQITPEGIAEDLFQPKKKITVSITKTSPTEVTISEA